MAEIESTRKRIKDEGLEDADEVDNARIEVVNKINDRSNEENPTIAEVDEATDNLEERNPRAAEVHWSWKRETLQTCKASINLYVRFTIIDDIKTELQIIGDEVYQEFANSCFGHFLRFHWQGFSCNVALHALLAREIRKADALDDEVWFCVGNQFIKFSKYEYALVTGLNFGPSPFDPNASHDPPEASVYGRLFQGGRRITLDSIRERFICGDFRHSAADALKVAKVLFLYYVLFGVDGRHSAIDRWVWALVEDTDRWESFPWGKYTFQILLRYIRTLPVSLPMSRPRQRLPTYHFYGCSVALLTWAYEAIPLLGSTCGERVSGEVLPRCLRWRFPKRIINMTGFFNNEMTCLEALEPSIDEQQQGYWQHLDEVLSSGIQYVHRENRFRRSLGVVATVVPTQRPWISTTAAVTNRRPQSSRSIVTPTTDVDATLRPQPSTTTIADRRARISRITAGTTTRGGGQKRQRLDVSGSDCRDVSHELDGQHGAVDEAHIGGGDSLLARFAAIIREEVDRLERRIPEIIRREIRLHFPHLATSTDEQVHDNGRLFGTPILTPATVAGHVTTTATTGPPSHH
ncbi:hypothetical protein ACS0TY_001009 [Phlomoides rotata]